MSGLRKEISNYQNKLKPFDKYAEFEIFKGGRMPPYLG